MKTRQETLNDLFFFPEENELRTKEISKFDWDSSISINLSTEEFLKVLKKIVSENLLKHVEGWANSIECREDIEFENDRAYEIIIELANPTLHGEITEEKLKGFIQGLK